MHKYPRSHYEAMAKMMGADWHYDPNDHTLYHSGSLVLMDPDICRGISWDEREETDRYGVYRKWTYPEDVP